MILKKMKRSALISLVLFFTTSCSYVTRDYVYSSYESTGWQFELQKGYQASVKHTPVPDKGVLTHRTEELELQLWSGYTVLMTSGPWLLPVIPSSMFGSREKLEIEGLLHSKSSDLTIDMSEIEVSMKSGKSKIQLKFRLKGVEDTFFETSSHTIGDGERYKFKMQFDIDARDVDVLTIDFHGITANGATIDIPTVILQVKPGSFNYDELTV